MKFFTAMLLTLIALPAAACDTTADQLIGSYIFESGDTVFETFELNADNTFNSWLHDRPETTGTWHYAGCIIFVDAEMHDVPVAMKVNSVGDTQLIVTFDSLKNRTTFNKVTTNKNP